MTKIIYIYMKEILVHKNNCVQLSGTTLWRNTFCCYYEYEEKKPVPVPLGQSQYLIV